MSNEEIRNGLKQYFAIDDGRVIAEILGYGDYMVQAHLASKVDKDDVTNPKTQFYHSLREEMERRGKF